MNKVLDIFALLPNFRNVLIDELNDADGVSLRKDIGNTQFFKYLSESKATSKCIDKTCHDIIDSMVDMPKEAQEAHNALVKNLVGNALDGNALLVVTPLICATVKNYLTSQIFAGLMRDGVYLQPQIRISYLSMSDYLKVLSDDNIEIITSETGIGRDESNIDDVDTSINGLMDYLKDVAKLREQGRMQMSDTHRMINPLAADHHGVVGLCRKHVHAEPSTDKVAVDAIRRVGGWQLVLGRKKELVESNDDVVGESSNSLANDMTSFITDLVTQLSINKKYLGTKPKALKRLIASLKDAGILEINPQIEACLHVIHKAYIEQGYEAEEGESVDNTAHLKAAQASKSAGLSGLNDNLKRRVGMGWSKNQPTTEDKSEVKIPDSIRELIDVGIPVWGNNDAAHVEAHTTKQNESNMQHILDLHKSCGCSLCLKAIEPIAHHMAHDPACSLGAAKVYARMCSCDRCLMLYKFGQRS